ncbi:aldehyde dehydrogenase family protein [Tardiphaga sp. 866_E4_N2_1]|uniref:aldehyde dehydrogenase family protein n=1 Tax=unclassified Tardiphaga TaxID=2631404 RepID=UPI003F26AB90
MSFYDKYPSMDAAVDAALPRNRGLYYDGKWQQALGGVGRTINPGTGRDLGEIAEANASDVDRAVQASHRAFARWRKLPPLERGALLRKVANVLRTNAEELALLDSANCGNPVTAMIRDVHDGAALIEFFAGLVTEAKGELMPMGTGMMNMTVQEPYGVCVRILAYNHPLMFAAGKLAAPLAVGNTVIIKPPPQAPLSTIRMMELLDGILPPGVLSMVTGGLECGQALVSHPLTPVVGLVGSVPAGKAVAIAAAARLKKTALELGGKNALVVYPDADISRTIEGALKGMNFTWCGQSCGSTSRLFIHEDVYDAVLEGVLEGIARFKPGIPTERNTNMGAIISAAQLEKIRGYVQLGRTEAKLAYGGGTPTDPHLKGGFYIHPTVFTNVDMSMRIASEEVFGPILSVLKWSDEEKMFADVNAVDYGLTGAVFTTNLRNAHHAASAIESGYIWVNDAGPHILGAPFGGFKMSGIGREETFSEIMTFTQTKNINITL